MKKLNWMCVGFPEWTAQFSVWKTAEKDGSEACAITCQNCAVYSLFPSGVTSHNKIARFNWECIVPFSSSCNTYSIFLSSDFMTVCATCKHRNFVFLRSWAWIRTEMLLRHLGTFVPKLSPVFFSWINYIALPTTWQLISNSISH